MAERSHEMAAVVVLVFQPFRTQFALPAAAVVLASNHRPKQRRSASAALGGGTEVVVVVCGHRKLALRVLVVSH